jgi:hypothetical protein
MSRLVIPSVIWAYLNFHFAFGIFIYIVGTLISTLLRTNTGMENGQRKVKKVRRKKREYKGKQGV